MNNETEEFDRQFEDLDNTLDQLKKQVEDEKLVFLFFFSILFNNFIQKRDSINFEKVN